jgi:surface antigen
MRENWSANPYQLKAVVIRNGSLPSGFRVYASGVPNSGTGEDVGVIVLARNQSGNYRTVRYDIVDGASRSYIEAADLNSNEDIVIGIYGGRNGVSAATFVLDVLPVQNYTNSVPTNSYPEQSLACNDIDNALFYARNCTSYIWWRTAVLRNMNDLNRPAEYFPVYNYMSESIPNAGVARLSHAKFWNERLNAIGYTVNGEPELGAIACWEGTTANGGFGHVAYVERVTRLSNGTTEILISEYNYQSACGYGTRVIRSNQSSYPDHFVHLP